MKKISQSVTVFILFCIIIILITFSTQAKAGALEGIKLCEEIIIPSLLPILIISNALINTKSGIIPALFFGLVSGYPSGAVLTCELYKKGVINEKEAERIMSFNFCGGAAFIISALGGVIYKNIKAGIVLFSSCVLSSLIIALFRFPFKAIKNKRTVNGMSVSDALCAAAESSVKSIAVMSAYIILFSALIGIFHIPDFAVPLLEITNGICKAKALPSLPFCAFFLSFGGLCIQFQLFSFLKKMNIKYYVFLIYRLFGGVLAFFVCKAILFFSDDASLASAQLSPSLPAQPSRLGVGLSMLMIIGCAVIVFDIENRKLQLIK